MLKVMSFNLRVDVEKDGINEFFNRSSRILATIKEENPDLIGFQEATDKIRAFMCDKLTDYTVIGCGRNRNYAGEGVLLAYRKNRFDLINFETHALSHTPEVFGTTYGEDQSKCPRVYHRAHLLDRTDNTNLAFYNIHTDHLGKKARVLEVKQVLEDMKAKKDSRILFTGDFNAQPDSECIQAVLADKEAGLIDLTANIPVSMTNYDQWQPGIKIDYIFTTFENADEAKSYVVKNEPIDGVYISDHSPVVAILP